MGKTPGIVRVAVRCFTVGTVTVVLALHLWGVAEAQEANETARVTGVSSWVLSAMANQDWHRKGWKYRTPVIVHNSSPIWQDNRLIRIDVDLPDGVSVASVRLTDQVGYDEVFQATKMGATIQLCFLATVPANSWRGYFVYSGKSRAKAPGYGSMLTRTRKSWEIDTGRIRAKFFKGQMPKLSPLYFLGVGERNFLADKRRGPCGAGTWEASAPQQGEALEEGPVTVKIGYPRMEFIFVKDNPFLWYRVKAGKGLKTQRSATSVPLDLCESQPTKAVFPTAKGLETVICNNMGAGKSTMHFVLPRVGQSISDNWLDLVGDRGRLGLVFNLSDYRLEFDDNSNMQIPSLARRDPELEIMEELICLDTDTPRLAAKLKFPLQVLRLEPQKAAELPPERVPSWADDFVFTTYAYMRLDDTEEAVHSLKMMGLNAFFMGPLGAWGRVGIFWKSGMDFPDFRGDYLGDVIEIAHKHKVGVGLRCGPARTHKQSKFFEQKLGKFSFCSEKWRKGYLEQVYKDLRSYDLDYLWALDEKHLGSQDFAMHEKFKEKYGYNPPQFKGKKYSFVPEMDLSDPKVWELFAFKTDEFTGYTTWVREMITKYFKRDIPCSANFNTSKLPGSDHYPETWVDMDKIADAGMTLALDPYYSSIDRLRFVLRFIRGAAHNRGTCWTAPGMTGVFTPGQIHHQMLYHALLGTRGMLLSTLNETYINARSEEREYYYNALWNLKSNVLPLVAKTRAVKFAGILWDRDSHLRYLRDSGKRENWQTSHYTDYDKEIVDYANLSSLQWQYVFKKDWAGLAEYPVVILPQDKYLEKKTVELVLDYARQGGTLVLSGALAQEHEEFSEALELKQKDIVPERVITRKTGQGRLIYFGTSLGSILGTDLRKGNELLRDALARHVELPVVCEYGLEPVLFKGDGYYLLGVGNVSMEPIRTRVRVNQVPSGPSAVFSLLEGEDAAVIEKGGSLSFEVAVSEQMVQFYRINAADWGAPPEIALTVASSLLKLEPARVPAAIPDRALPDYVAALQQAGTAGKVRVGIVEPYRRKRADSLLAALQDREQIHAVKLPPKDIRAEVLDHMDVLVFEALKGNLATADPDWADAVRAFVQNGGGILLTHSSVGGYWRCVLTFPEVGLGIQRYLGSTAVPTGQGGPLTADLKPGAQYRHPYYDHLVLACGANSMPVMKDAKGHNLVVAGSQGKGRVVLSGFLLGIEDDGSSTPPKDWAADFFANVVTWLAAK